MTDLIIGQGFTVVVDYTHSLQEMIAAGRYSKIGAGITRTRFSLPQGGYPNSDNYKFFLVHFPERISMNSLHDKFREGGFHPARIIDLLAFGAQYPEKQKKYRIAAMGSCWLSRNGYMYFPYLHCRGGKRILQLGGVRDEFAPYYRFLVFYPTPIRST